MKTKASRTAPWEVVEALEALYRAHSNGKFMLYDDKDYSLVTNAASVLHKAYRDTKMDGEISDETSIRQRYKLAAPITDQMVDALMEEYDSDDTRVLDTIALWAGRYADAMMLEDKRHEQESK